MDWNLVRLAGWVLAGLGMLSFFLGGAFNSPPTILTLILIITGGLLYKIGDYKQHNIDVSSSLESHLDNTSSDTYQEAPDADRKACFHLSNHIGDSNKMNHNILGPQFNRSGDLMGCVHASEGVKECPGCYYYGSCCYADKNHWMCSIK